MGLLGSVYLLKEEDFVQLDQPEIAKKEPKELETHGDVRVDDYFWMNQRDSDGVLSFLKSENAYANQVLKPTEPLQKTLFEEMKSRMVEDESTVPVQVDEYFYYRRYEPGQEYPISARKKGSLQASEEILVNGNDWAKGKSYFQMTGTQITRDHKMIAVGADTTGRRFYDLRFKMAGQSEFLPLAIENTTGNFVWASDSKTLFFSKQDPETLRSFQIYRIDVSSETSPTLVYEEKDTTYQVAVGGSKNKSKIFIESSKRDSSEVRWVPSSQPTSEFKVFHPRQENWEYSLSDGGDRFYILTNFNAENYRLMEAPFEAKGVEDWKEVLPNSPDILREGFDLYEKFFVMEERQNGLTQIRVVQRGDLSQKVLSFEDPTYVTSVTGLPNYASEKFRFTYESLNRPEVTYDEDFLTGKREVKKTKEVPGFDPSKYESRRLWATAKDGRKIPLSVLVKKGAQLGKETPLLLYAYGSYGYSMEPYFRSSVFSLVDRGFVYAIAHIRGGSEMGRFWYEEGRLGQKVNTFTDFIESAEYLISEGYTSKDHLHIMGGSAGGLLMGAVINMRPDLFKSAVAAVPFVDVVTTMLDESIPLTTFEYKEWGDPRVKKDYEYIKSYSPYDNVKAQEYPNLFVTTGYHDSQVQYWEPAKWVAKLRELKTGSNELIFYTEMDAGHSGASGRYESLKMVAKEYSFFLLMEGQLN
ncbi:MAG: S9 family peptidase [Bdellovibrionales bacterium]|nr:S9 family peptidase [Bdellovibrionales bacterium]